MENINLGLGWEGGGGAKDGNESFIVLFEIKIKLYREAAEQS